MCFLTCIPRKDFFFFLQSTEFYHKIEGSWPSQAKYILPVFFELNQVVILHFGEFMMLYGDCIMGIIITFTSEPQL